MVDWYIAITLAAPYIFLTDVFVQLAALRAYFYRRRQGDVPIEALIEANSRGQSGLQQRELLETALAVYRTQNALFDALDRHDPADDEFDAARRARVDFGRAARASPEVEKRYTVKLVRKEAPSPHETRAVDETKLEADLLRACMCTGMTYGEAEPAKRLVMAAARREYAADRARQAWLEVQEGLHAARTRDVVIISGVCVIWAGFQLVRPWLYWVGLGKGRTEGCDVQLMWFFLPTSLYGREYGIWLKVWGVLMAIVGLTTFAYALFLLATKVFAVGKKGRSRGLLSDVESQTSLLGGSEVLGPSSSFSDGERHIGGRPGRPCRLYFRCLGVLQFLVLGVVASMVEVTLSVNNIDMEGGGLKLTSQILALGVGVVASMPVYWECLVIMPMRWMGRLRSEGGPVS